MMPLIIDANRCVDFKSPTKHHATEIVLLASKKKLRIAIGEALLKELVLTPIRDLLVEWTRSGIAVNADKKAIAREVVHCKNNLSLESNDAHIIALARATNSKLLYSDDGNLISDFTAKETMSPRGKAIRTTTPSVAAKRLFKTHGA